MSSPSRDESPTLTLNQHHRPGTSPPTPDVRLYHRAVVAPMEPPLRYAWRGTTLTEPGRLGCMRVWKRSFRLWS